MMIIKTESIIEILEGALNKEISEVSISDLDTITYLRINRISIDDVLVVDSSDLQYFHNLEELSIENCMIDDSFIENLKKTNIGKISFIHCEFVDDVKEYFEQLSINELVLNDVVGLNDLIFANIKELTFVDCSFKGIIANVEKLDISRSEDINIDFNNSYINELVINTTQYVDDMYLKGKIIIEDEYDVIKKVISND